MTLSQGNIVLINFQIQNHLLLVLTMYSGGCGTKKLVSKWRVSIEASLRFKDMNWTLMERWVKVFGE